MCGKSPTPTHEKQESPKVEQATYEKRESPKVEQAKQELSLEKREICLNVKAEDFIPPMAESMIIPVNYEDAKYPTSTHITNFTQRCPVSKTKIEPCNYCGHVFKSYSVSLEQQGFVTCPRCLVGLIVDREKFSPRSDEPIPVVTRKNSIEDKELKSKIIEGQSQLTKGQKKVFEDKSKQSYLSPTELGKETQSENMVTTEYTTDQELNPLNLSFNQNYSVTYEATDHDFKKRFIEQDDNLWYWDDRNWDNDVDGKECIICIII